MSYTIEKLLVFQEPANNKREHEEIWAKARQLAELINEYAPDCANKVHAFSLLRDSILCTNWALDFIKTEKPKPAETNTPGVPL
jgi:hypothetical protein